MPTQKCSGCGAMIRFQPELVGKRVKCPKCQNPVLLTDNAISYPPSPQAKGEERLRYLADLDAQKKARMKRYALIGGIAVVVVIALGIGVLALTRDTWEKDNREKILALKAEGDRALEADKMLAYRKYSSVIEMVKKRELRDYELREALTEIKEQIEKLGKELAGQVEEERRAEEARKEEECRLREAKEAERLAQEKREADEKRLAAERRRREELYKEYLQKSEAFYDSLYRTNSDLQVGITLQVFGDRVRDMNFQYNKWVESLTNQEKLYPSARLMEAALNRYLKSQEIWQKRIGESDKDWPEVLDILLQNHWKKATILLSWAKECRQKSDVVQKQPCLVCEGKGKLICPVCSDTGKCPVCEGTGKYKWDCPICSGTGKCSVCEGTGKWEGKMTCYRCSGTGKCSVCEGKGKMTCSMCSGTGKCRRCKGGPMGECPVCAGTGSFPP